jgi:branched-chain amino acid transport system substrate-binding protein
VVGLPATVSRAALDAIHVAVVVDTSWAGGVYGAPVLQGMLLAAPEINARGGVNGHALDLTVSDGRSDLARVTALVRRACHDTSMVGLVGPTLSSEAVKVDPLAQAAGLPVLAVPNTVPGLTANGPYIFRIALGNAQIIPVVLKTAQARLHFQKVAVLYDAVNVATAAGRIFGAVAARMDLTVVATQTFASGATHFGPPWPPSGPLGPMTAVCQTSATSGTGETSGPHVLVAHSLAYRAEGAKVDQEEAWEATEVVL